MTDAQEHNPAAVAKNVVPLGLVSGTTYAEIAVNASGEVLIDETALDSRYVEVAGDTMTGALVIDGSADANQLRIQGHSSQANSILIVEQSDGTDVLDLDNDGLLIIGDGGAADSTIGFYDTGVLAWTFGFDDSATSLVLANGVLDGTNDKVVIIEDFYRFIGEAALGNVLASENYSATTIGAGLVMRGSRGTYASPTATLSGDVVGLLVAQGNEDTTPTFSNAAAIYFQAEENFSSSALGSSIRFFTTDNGTTTNDERMMIDENGEVGIGTSAPAAQLHVDQASTTAAVPVLYLDQADISEEMIEFNTTIGVGNAIEAVGAKTLTTTHFIKVTLPGGLTRYFPVGTIA